ncbi:uncharacterized protein LOC135468313 [Liolophura sinensis]|uniref:uncharacterized protein LOC135468313 n=1 Tax=Liolophura sinensis TaxID=3198878 RepID=UPI0031584C86
MLQYLSTVVIQPAASTLTTMPLLLLCILACPVVGESGGCEQRSDCGFGSGCVNQTCDCEEGLTLHSNLKDCVNASCSNADCVRCVEGTCQRCVHFIDKQTRECLRACTGKAEIIDTGNIQGNVCTQIDGPSDLSDIIIGIVAGVSAGILLCVILGLCVHFHLKRKRGRVNLQGRYLHTNSMEMGHMRKIPVFENRGFIVHPEPPVINKEDYLKEVEKMKPNAQMLLDLLNQIRKRVRAMEPNDARIPTYKGVIHQLCRVLVMLNKKDAGSSVPADGLSLLEWAKQMLQDYVETRQSLEDGETEEEGRANPFPTTPTPETTSTSISSERPTVVNTVYASPIDSLERSRTDVIPDSRVPVLTRHSPGHYSSVPVPYIETHMQANGTLRPGKTVLVSAPMAPKENSGGSAESYGVRSGYRNYPTPRPVAISQNPAGAPHLDSKSGPDIYAPASSYSDYTQPKISTFSGGVARSISDNSNESNSDYDSEEDPNPDGLPFDLEDATEPVEV